MVTLFWLVVGALAGAWYVRFARQGHVGRERRAYSNGLLIAAAIYPLLALFTWDLWWLLIEMLGVILYGIFVLRGLQWSFFFIGLGWLMHPFWDVIHLLKLGPPVVPDWYAIACISFDVLLGVVVLQRVSSQWRGPSDGTTPPLPTSRLTEDGRKES